MNCPLCGEVCNCSAETDTGSLGPAAGGVAARIEEDESAAWRDELAAKLSTYRARRKPRPPRYPSLRLVFDRPTYLAEPAPEERDAFGSISQNALALNPFSSSDPKFAEARTKKAEIALPANDDSSAAAELLQGLPQQLSPNSQQAASYTVPHIAPHIAKIIEFPRLASAAPPVRLNELAEPVSCRPRILDVPDVIPPPPALGGITIESAQRPAPEKRPGIDIPLQSAPLGRRLVAAVIDAIVLASACAVCGLIFWKVAGVVPPRLELLILAVVTPGFLWATYQHLLIVYAGSTLGLRFTRLELTCFNGKPASRALRRWRVLASYLSALSLGMGYAWVFLDEDQLCWHDRITHTYLAPKENTAPSAEVPAIV